MPTAFKRYAVDFDGDGRRDVVDSIPDLIASTANNLKNDGWASGQTWGYEVVVPPSFNFLLADRSSISMTLARMGAARRRARRRQAVPAPDERAYLLVPAGAQGPGFLMLHNFRVIMSYNPAEAYAIAIGHLADRLRGGEAVRAALAAPRARALARRSGSNCRSCWPARLRHRRAGRPARRQDAGGGPRLPGPDRGWFPTDLRRPVILDQLRPR